MPISLDPVCPCHLRILTAPPAHSCEGRNLSWQCFSGVIAISWNPCLFRRFALTSPSLSFGVSFSYIRPSSLDILFSPHPILLTRLSLGAFFLYPFVLTYVCSLFLLKLVSFETFCLSSTASCYKSCTKYFPVLLRTTKLAGSTSHYYFVLQSLHKVLPSTTSYYKACREYFPLLLRATKLAQSTSQYYFVLQSLHKVLPTTTSYYKACTKYFPVLLRTTNLAESTSHYYFVLQSLHKVLPSTTSYYKACREYFPLLLRATKLAQSTSQYYFVLQSLQSVLPSTTSYYEACTKYFPVLLVTKCYKILSGTYSNSGTNKQKNLSRSFSWQLHMSQRVDGSEMWYQNILKLASSIQLRSC